MTAPTDYVSHLPALACLCWKLSAVTAARFAEPRWRCRLSPRRTCNCRELPPPAETPAFASSWPPPLPRRNQPPWQLRPPSNAGATDQAFAAWPGCDPFETVGSSPATTPKMCAGSALRLHLLHHQ